MFCTGTIESQEHVFRCPYQASWQCTFIDNLQNHLIKDDTDPDIQRIMVEGIDAWLTERPPLAGLLSQTNIGWEQFLYGYISFEWGLRQARYKNNDAIAYTWSMRLIQFLWYQSKAGWTAHNERVHDKESDIAAQHYRSQLEEKIRRIYSCYDSLSAKDKDLLSVPLEERLQLPDKPLQLWLDKNAKLITHCVQQHKLQTANSNQDIRSFFSNILGNRLRR